MRFTEIAKPKEKRKTKAEIEKLRMGVQAGTIDRKQGFDIRKQLIGVIEKYIKDDEWELKQNNQDVGLYYLGSDLTSASQTGKEIVGALYGYFQDGSKKSITKLKREEDDETMTFTAIPTPDKFGDRKSPQISFTWYKNPAATDGAVIGILIN